MLFFFIVIKYSVCNSNALDIICNKYGSKEMKYTLSCNLLVSVVCHLVYYINIQNKRHKKMSSETDFNIADNTV